MDCNCIQEVEKMATEHLHENGKFKKPVKRVKLSGIGFTPNNGIVGTRTYSNLEIELEGQKKKITMPLFHNYCPYCGKKIGEESYV